MNEPVVHRDDGEPCSSRRGEISREAPVPRLAFREREGQGIRVASWLCRDGVPFGVNVSTWDGVRILVICSVCRRVRNAAGDWAPVPEEWWPCPHVLSHAYCPACFEREARALMES